MKYLYKIKGFFLNIANLFRWAPTIWKDRDWDYSFMLELERKKLKRIARWYEKNNYGHCVNGKKYYTTICWAIGCLDIILEQDWWTIDFPKDKNWLECWDEHENYYRIKPYINLNNYKRFLPYVNDDSIKNHPKLWATELREEKAWQLYNKLRNQYMRDWWD